MLSEKEITILSLIRGVSFASVALSIPRSEVIKIVINNDCFEFWNQIRKQLLNLAESNGSKYVCKTFCVDKERLNVLKAYKEPPLVECLDDFPKRKKNFQVDEEEDKKHDESLVTHSSFLKSINKKKSKGVILDKITAKSKEFLVLEAEKLSSRFGICEKYDVDRMILKDWTRSFHKTGRIRASTKKYAAASELLQKAYNELLYEFNNPS